MTHTIIRDQVARGTMKPLDYFASQPNIDNMGLYSFLRHEPKRDKIDSLLRLNNLPPI